MKGERERGREGGKERGGKGGGERERGREGGKERGGKGGGGERERGRGELEGEKRRVEKRG